MGGAVTAMARGVQKVVLEIYPVKDENGVLVGKYQWRIRKGGNPIDIPADFAGIIKVESLTGEAVSGTVEGLLSLVYGGPEPCPEPYAELNGMAIHSVDVIGFQGISIPCNYWWAIADAQVAFEWVSKEAPVPVEPVEEGV
jgi:hypothetical protein